MGKDAEGSGLGYFKVLSWRSHGRNEEYLKKTHIKQGSRCPARESNQAPLEYQSEALPPEPT
jgi:hypothetical protein